LTDKIFLCRLGRATRNPTPDSHFVGLRYR